MNIYCIYDDIAKKPVELFLAVSEEEATLKLDNQIEVLKKKYGKFKYRVHLLCIAAEYDEKNARIVKIYKSKG